MDSYDLNKGFAVAWITREDIRSQLELDLEQVARLTDHEMKQIASMMADLYNDHGYWEDLELCANRLLREKEEEHGLA